MTDNSTPRSLAGMKPHSALSSNLPHSETRSLSELVTHAASENSKQTPGFEATSATSNPDESGSSRLQQLLERVDRALRPADASSTLSSQPNDGKASDTQCELVDRPAPSMDMIKVLAGAENKPLEMDRFLSEGPWTPIPNYYKGEEEKSL